MKKNLPTTAADTIREMTAAGNDFVVIAAHFGMSDDTLRARIKEDPALAEARKRGMADEHKKLLDRLKEISRSDANTSAAATMFLLKTRHGYREGAPEESGNRVLIVLPDAMSREQYAKKLGSSRAT